MWLAETAVSRVRFWWPVHVGPGSDHRDSTAAGLPQSYCLSKLPRRSVLDRGILCSPNQLEFRPEGEKKHKNKKKG